MIVAQPPPPPKGPDIPGPPPSDPAPRVIVFDHAAITHIHTLEAVQADLRRRLRVVRLSGDMEYRNDLAGQLVSVQETLAALREVTAW